MRDMSKVKFKLNLPGLNELMKSSAMQSELIQHGSRVLSGAQSMAQVNGAEYSMNTRTINWIAVTTIRADNYEARKDNYENNTLLKALGGGQ